MEQCYEALGDGAYILMSSTFAELTCEQLYDSCKVSGYRWFVITTYNYWVFGTWSLGTYSSRETRTQSNGWTDSMPADWSAVEVTEPLPFDKTHGMSLVELLVFWTQSARHRLRYWQLAPVR